MTDNEKNAAITEYANRLDAAHPHILKEVLLSLNATDISVTPEVIQVLTKSVRGVLQNALDAYEHRLKNRLN